MKKSFRFVTILVVLGIAFGGVIVGLAQNRPIVGGYKVIANDDPDAVAAAEFAVTEQGKKENIIIKLLSIEHAERQVVAGTNYKFCMRVGKGEDPEDVDVKVIVFRSLQKKYTVKSWEEETCSEPETDEDPTR